MERDWKRKRLEAYKIFGKEFRKTLPKTEGNKPVVLMSRGNARSDMFKLALANALMISGNDSIDSMVDKFI